MSKRVCLICTEKLPVPPVRGGAIQTYIDGVLPHLRAAGLDVTVVCRRDPLFLPDHEPGFVRVDGDHYVANVRAYLASVAPFDSVVIYNRPQSVPVIAQAAQGADLILSMHNDMFGPDRMPPDEARAILRRLSAVVTISDHVRKTIDSWHPGFTSKMRTIRSGVDLELFHPASADEKAAARRSLGLPADAPVVLHVSRLSERKGNLLVVRAMAAVHDAHPDAILQVVGSSRYGSNHLEPYGLKVVTEAGRLLGGRSRFAGFVAPSALASYFASADLFVCSSQWEEPLARVHYEAMAAGLPIVTTDRGGNAEVIEEGGNGLFARPYASAGAFADCIGRLLADPDERLRLGRRGRALAEERYSWGRVAAELGELLGGAVTGPEGSK
ncbi:MAG: putative lipopolysaccharide N-acetylglucosaminyltransferase [Symbiobacteriaceae bacterium]|jgi:spore coat protein SA|nr:putative lipopolysaccharide N-acetylglucosaminyltransferase [Symbiobacteriaceae bacterium]